MHRVLLILCKVLEYLQKLKSDLETREQKARLSIEMRESMANQVQMYKDEVKQQRDIIKVWQIYNKLKVSLYHTWRINEIIDKSNKNLKYALQ